MGAVDPAVVVETVVVGGGGVVVPAEGVDWVVLKVSDETI